MFIRPLLLSCVLLLVAIQFDQSEAQGEAPGLALRVRGLINGLRGARVPDARVRPRRRWWTFHSMTLRNINAGRVTATINGLAGTVSVRGGFFDVAGRYAKQGIIRRRTKRGDVFINGRNVDITVGFRISSLRLQVTSCSARIRNLNVSFRGSLSAFFFNLVRGLLSKAAQPSIERLLCDQIRAQAPRISLGDLVG